MFDVMNVFLYIYIDYITNLCTVAAESTSEIPTYLHNLLFCVGI